MEHALYWLWLVTKFNGANAKIKRLLKAFGSVEGVYSSQSFDNIRGLTERDKARLKDKDLSAANKITEKMGKLGGKIIVIDSGHYPKILKQIHNPPPVLYVKGNMPPFDDVLTIGVVGTRMSTEYGHAATQRLSAGLARAGVITVSGLAEGIDAAGAWATIDEGGTAVGVIASGIDIAYPPKNAALYQEIVKNGCIITEFPPGTAPIPRHFPMRNRIIAGLSHGLLVTEAPGRSGALITARLAAEEGRDVFAVPGNITDINMDGTNTIIQQGAKLVLSAEDILSEYPYAKKIDLKSAPKQEKTVPKTNSADRLNGLTEKQEQITALLIKGDMEIDELARETGMNIGELNMQLTMLELKKIITKLPGNRYRINI